MRFRTLVLCAFVSGLVGLAGCGDGDPAEPDAGGGGGDSGAPMDAGEDPSTCGDGVVQRPAGEICDDGNTDDGDGCSASCSSDETCGNGVHDVAAGELCDDGNTDDGDGCRADCLSDYRCGNGVRDTIADGAEVDEVCDDGNTVNADGCSAACDSDESCGNAIVDLGAGEVCDDGNTDDGDDCSADCSTSLLCGNGTVDGAEECDDGNGDAGDGCDDSCRIERCGNGRVDTGEACDDGNTDDADGCRNDCTFTCSGDTDCADADVCNGAETCTDPGTATSACAPAAAPASDGTACGAGQICISGGCVASACGDGLADGSEQCDDGNTTSGDGCDSDCTWTCSTAADCGDANVCNGAETCTAGGTIASRCAPGTPASNGTSCGAGGLVCNMGACVAAGCGDAIVSGAEQCDDGNATNGDGCDTDCTWTCAAAADCSDGNACNGAETCTAGGTLASRCGAGTPPAAGTSCGGANICVSGACVASRCGDAIRTGAEQCDDGNTTSGDGCDNDCAWTCTTATAAARCGDGNLCNGTEVCTSGGTLMSRCGAGTPPAAGTTCDRDMSAATRDICRTNMCVASACGDGYLDAGATPAEQCDDGNTTNGDGCSSTCQTEIAAVPTGFRIVDLDLVSPRVTVNMPLGAGCQDITNNCASLFGSCQADGVNTQLSTALSPMPGGTYSLHLVSLFRPFGPASATSPMEIHFNPDCMQSPTPDSCAADAVMPDFIMTTGTNTSAGTCFSPVAAEVNTRAGTPTAYTPGVSTTSGPCFITSPQAIVVDIGGILIPLQDTRFAATYSGATVGSRRLVSGVMRGFLSERQAADVLLPADLALIGGDPLYEHLQAGNRAVANTAGAMIPDGCDVGGGTDEDDADMNGTTRGFWFFLNFTAEEITWTGP